jgi:hypothetical protein
MVVVARMNTSNTSTVPEATNFQVPVVQNRNGSVTTNTVTAAQLPAAKNLAVPFTSQAPDANWDADHEEFCEEAAALMVGRFFQQKGITSKADAEAGLQQLKAWELDHLGWYFDTTAAETANMITAVYGLQVRLKQQPTIQDIKEALANQKLVIAPTAGRELGNPNFTGEGPVYHNLVIRGYTSDGKFITNDPGTRKGEGYLYRQSVILKALHDWVPSGSRSVAASGTATGPSVILIISR